LGLENVRLGAYPSWRNKNNATATVYSPVEIRGVLGRLATRDTPSPRVGMTDRLTLRPIGKQKRVSVANGRFPDREQRPEVRRVVALLLSLGAGFVVAVGIVTFSGIEFGPMTGNTVATGVQIGTRGTDAILTRLVPIPAYGLGVAVGVALIEMLGRRARSPIFARVLGVEAALLTLFMVIGESTLVRGGARFRSTWELDMLVALPCVALGLQTAALRRVSGRTVRTTFMTGMLTRFAEEGVVWLYMQRDIRREGPRSHWAHAVDGRRVLFVGGLWLVYLAGAIAGASFEARWNLWALAVPIAVLVVAAAVDCVAPLYENDVPSFSRSAHDLAEQRADRLC
jgi:uncharacterized membrane protein YoaK (UPF0700 family)